MTDKEKVINRKLQDILKETKKIKVGFNLCLPTVEAQRSIIIDKIQKLQHYIKYDEERIL